MKLYSVLCAGCTVPIGVSAVPNPLRNKVHCSALCEAQPAVSANEFRDDLIITLARTRPVAEVAELFGLSKPAVYNRLATYRGIDVSSVLA